jgi:molecular chaperone GrpE (heat shock protein)
MPPWPTLLLQMRSPLGGLLWGCNSTGFVTLETTTSQRPASATKPPHRVKKGPPTKEGQEIGRRERAEAMVVQAKSIEEAATLARNEAQTTLQEAKQSAADASNRVNQLRKELHGALEAQSNAQKDYRRAQAEFDRADRRAQDAQQQLSDSATE